MNTILRLLLAIALTLGPLDAWAASGATTVQADDAGSTARNFNVFSSTGAVTGNLSWMNTICDFTTLTQCATVTSGGSLQVGGQGTAGSAAGGVVTVQGVTSMTPVQVSQATAASLNATVVGTGTFAVQAAQSGTWNVTNAGTFATQVNGFTSWAGGTLGSMANYGTSPGAVLVPGVNAFVTNANANGQAAAANSSPVVPPSDMAGNVPIANLVFGTTAAMTGTTSTQLLAAVSSKILYVMNISCVNSSTTGTFVTVQDGSGGTALGTLTAAPSFGGDEQHNSTIPLYKTTAGNGLYVADVTTSGNVICTASGWHS